MRLEKEWLSRNHKGIVGWLFVKWSRSGQLATHVVVELRFTVYMYKKYILRSWIERLNHVGAFRRSHVTVNF